MTENSEHGTLSLEEAAATLLLPESDDDQPVAEEDADPAEVTEDEAEVQEDDTAEAEDDEGETDDDDESEPEDDGDDDDEFVEVYEIDGEEVTLSELQEWRKNGLRQSDYTKKTQEVAEERKAIQAEKTAFNAEVLRVTEELRQQQTQLKEALATFAVQSEQEPDWVEAARTMEPKAYQALQAEWAEKRQRNTQAQQAYQALQARQAQEVAAREQAALLEKRPEWGSKDVFAEAAPKMVAVANEFGFSQEEIAGIVDHRMFLVLDALAEARAASAKVDDEQVKAKKRVVKAAKRVPPGSKPGKNQAASKKRRSNEDRLRKTGRIEDALSLIME